jgi:hypothetical protein
MESDGMEQREVSFMLKDYAEIDYGYAAIPYKAYSTPSVSLHADHTRYGRRSGPCRMSRHRRGVKV